MDDFEWEDTADDYDVWEAEQVFQDGVADWADEGDGYREW